MTKAYLFKMVTQLIQEYIFVTNGYVFDKKHLLKELRAELKGYIGTKNNKL